MAMLNNQRVIAMQMGYDWGYTSDQANVEQNQRVEMSKDGDRWISHWCEATKETDVVYSRKCQKNTANMNNKDTIKKGVTQ